MKSGTRILIKDTTTKQWDSHATVVEYRDGICYFEYVDEQRQQTYIEKYQELPCMIYMFSGGLTNENVRIIEEK